MGLYVRLAKLMIGSSVFLFMLAVAVYFSSPIQPRYTDYMSISDAYVLSWNFLMLSVLAAVGGFMIGVLGGGEVEEEKG